MKHSLPLLPLLALLLAGTTAGLAATATPTSPPQKPEADVTTVGPPIVLTAGQRALLAAKHALRFAPAPMRREAPTVKSPVETVPSADPGVPGAARAKFGPEPASPTQDAARDGDAVRSAMGPERARAAGLVKRGAPADAGARKERRP